MILNRKPHKTSQSYWKKYPGLQRTPLIINWQRRCYRSLKGSCPNCSFHSHQCNSNSNWNVWATLHFFTPICQVGPIKIFCMMHGCAITDFSPQLWTPLDALGSIFCSQCAQWQPSLWHALLFSSCYTDLSIIMQRDGVCERSTAPKQTTRRPQFSTPLLFSANLPDLLSVLDTARLVCHPQKLFPWLHLLIPPINPSDCWLFPQPYMQRKSGQCVAILCQECNDGACISSLMPIPLPLD